MDKISVINQPYFGRDISTHIRSYGISPQRVLTKYYSDFPNIMFRLRNLQVWRELIGLLLVQISQEVVCQIFLLPVCNLVCYFDIIGKQRVCVICRYVLPCCRLLISFLLLLFQIRILDSLRSYLAVPKSRDGFKRQMKICLWYNAMMW